MKPAEPLNGPADETERIERDRATARMVAVADIYVLTNRIRDLLEDRLEAIGRAVGSGAADEEIARALGGADAPGSESDRHIIEEEEATP